MHQTLAMGSIMISTVFQVRESFPWVRRNSSLWWGWMTRWIIMNTWLR